MMGRAIGVGGRRVFFCFLRSMNAITTVEIKQISDS